MTIALQDATKTKLDLDAGQGNRGWMNGWMMDVWMDEHMCS